MASDEEAIISQPRPDGDVDPAPLSPDLTAPLLEESSSSPPPNRHSLRRRRSDHHPRFLDRAGAFHQSRGRWRVTRVSMGSVSAGQQGRCCYVSSCCGCLGRFWNEWVVGDWFHRLAYQRTCVLMIILFVIYSSLVVFFAFIYLGVSILGQQTEVNPDGSQTIIGFCDMDIHDHMEALYFSLSTMTTIGYGVSDYYFGGCWTPLLLVLWQVCSAITFDAVAVGLLFHRISRGRKRGKTILFSDKAVVRRVKGVPYLMFRIGELRRYHLIEATIRCYLVRHERLPLHQHRVHPQHQEEERATTQSSLMNKSNENNNNKPVRIETTHFVSRQVKLMNPDESYGPQIWMGLPQVIVHRMDHTSPLVPTSPWYDADGIAHACPWEKDDPTNTDVTTEDPLASPFSSSSPPSHRANVLEKDEIEHFLWDRDAELIVLVEGTDEGTGAATQARHSYKASDLTWNETFVPCVEPTAADLPSRPGGPVCSIDFARFHETRPAPEDVETCAYIPD